MLLVLLVIKLMDFVLIVKQIMNIIQIQEIVTTCLVNTDSVGGPEAECYKFVGKTCSACGKNNGFCAYYTSGIGYNPSVWKWTECPINTYSLDVLKAECDKCVDKACSECDKYNGFCTYCTAGHGYNTSIEKSTECPVNTHTLGGPKA